MSTVTRPVTYREPPVPEWMCFSIPVLGAGKGTWREGTAVPKVLLLPFNLCLLFCLMGCVCVWDPKLHFDFDMWWKQIQPFCPHFCFYQQWVTTILYRSRHILGNSGCINTVQYLQNNASLSWELKGSTIRRRDLGFLIFIPLFKPQVRQWNFTQNLSDRLEGRSASTIITKEAEILHRLYHICWHFQMHGKIVHHRCIYNSHMNTCW